MKENKQEILPALLVALAKALCYAALFLVCQFLAVLVYIAAVSLSVDDAAEVYERLNADSILLTLASGLLTIAIILVFYLVRRKKLGEALWLRPVPAPTLLSGVTLAPAMYLIVTVILALLPEAWMESYSEAASGLDDTSAMAFIAIVLVAPVVEELVFRGLMMTRLRQAMPGWLAAALSAAVFGLFHGHPVWFGYAFVLGFIFGLMDLRANSILPSMLGHVAFNLINQLLTLVPESESGTEMLIAMAVLLLAAIVLPILNRKGVASVFRPAPKAPPAPPTQPPARYDFDPWDY